MIGLLITDLLERTERKKPTENVQAGDPDAAEYSAVLSFDNIETRDEFLVELAIIKLPGASRTTPVGGEECGASFEASLTVADCMNVNMFFKAKRRCVQNVCREAVRSKMRNLDSGIFYYMCYYHLASRPSASLV